MYEHVRHIPFIVYTKLFNLISPFFLLSPFTISTVSVSHFRGHRKLRRPERFIPVRNDIHLWRVGGVISPLAVYIYQPLPRMGTRFGAHQPVRDDVTRNDAVT